MSGFNSEADLGAEFRRLQQRLSALERVRPRAYYSEALGEVSTASPLAVDLGGPSIEVRVNDDGLIAIFASVTMGASGGGTAHVHVYEPTDCADANTVMQTSVAPYGTPTRITSPGVQSGAERPRGGWLLFRVSPGLRTVSLRYSHTAPGTGFFKERRIWVQPVMQSIGA